MLCHEHRQPLEPHLTCHFVGTGIALALGALGAAGSLGGAALSSSASKNAAKTQASSAQQALDFQKGVYDDQKANQQPFLQAGTSSIGKLMEGLNNGTFGPGSIPSFEAPSLAEARATPGYQFTQQQGINAIDRSAAARGGLGSGSTLQRLQSFGSGLADSTYNDVFNRSLSTYQTKLQGQSQAFNELLAPSQLGENAASNINATGSQAASNIGNLMTQQGNATAAGQVGSANAWSSGIGGTTNSILQALLLGGAGQQKPAVPVGQGAYDPTILAGLGSTADKWLGS